MCTKLGVFSEGQRKKPRSLLTNVVCRQIHGITAMGESSPSQHKKTECLGFTGFGVVVIAGLGPTRKSIFDRIIEPRVMSLISLCSMFRYNYNMVR